MRKDKQIRMRANDIHTTKSCPLCNTPNMVLRQDETGLYLGCRDYPKCKGKVELKHQGKEGSGRFRGYLLGLLDSQ